MTDAQRRYKLTPKGRAAIKRHNASAAGRAAYERYRFTDAYREHTRFRLLSTRTRKRIQESKI